MFPNRTVQRCTYPLRPRPRLRPRLAAAVAIDPSFGTHEVERSVVLEPYKERVHAHGQLNPVDGYPPKRIVDDADLPRFLDYFVQRLLGPVNPVYGRGTQTGA